MGRKTANREPGGSTIERPPTSSGSRRKQNAITRCLSAVYRPTNVATDTRHSREKIASTRCGRGSSEDYDDGKYDYDDNNDDGPAKTATTTTTATTHKIIRAHPGLERWTASPSKSSARTHSTGRDSRKTRLCRTHSVSEFVFSPNKRCHPQRAHLNKYDIERPRV